MPLGYVRNVIFSLSCLNGNALSDIDKSDPMRSHVSDALGYMIAKEFGMRPKGGAMPGVMQ